jgi:hypothetical protein
LRHSVDTHLLEDGINLRVIQALLGPAKLNATAFYKQVATKTMRAIPWGGPAGHQCGSNDNRSGSTLIAAPVGSSLASQMYRNAQKYRPAASAMARIGKNPRTAPN